MGRPVRYAIVGMPPAGARELARRLHGSGEAVAMVDELHTPPEPLERLGATVALLDASADPDAALAAAERLVDRLDVVLLVERPDVDLLRRAMRLGCLDALDPWSDLDALRQALAEGGRRGVAGARGRLVAVLGTAGGVGATTIAISLARLRGGEEGGDVVLVDADAAGGAVAAALGIERPVTVEDLADRLDAASFDAAVRMVDRAAGGLRVVSQPDEGADRDRVRAVVTALAVHFPEVVVELGGALDDAALAISLEADDLLVVATQELRALRRAVFRTAMLRRLGWGGGGLRLVLNRYDPRRFPDADEVGRRVGVPVAATVANDWRAAQAAWEDGLPLVDARPRSAAARDLARLAEALGPVGRVGRGRR